MILLSTIPYRNRSYFPFIHASIQLHLTGTYCTTRIYCIFFLYTYVYCTAMTRKSVGFDKVWGLLCYILHWWCWGRGYDQRRRRWYHESVVARGAGGVWLVVTIRAERCRRGGGGRCRRRGWGGRGWQSEGGGRETKGQTPVIILFILWFLNVVISSLSCLYWWSICAFSILLSLALRFWNQILIWVSVRSNDSANSKRRGLYVYNSELSKTQHSQQKCVFIPWYVLVSLILELQSESLVGRERRPLSALASILASTTRH